MSLLLALGGPSTPPAGGAASIVEAADVASGAGSSIAPAFGSGAAQEAADIAAGTGTVTTPLTASCTPTFASAEGFAPITLTTNTTTASGSGGAGGYTYSWALSDTSGPTITITGPTSAITAFSAHLSPGSTASAIATCTVTDSLGATAQCICEVNITSTN